jgi:class 3 adenylate cyclase
VLAGGRVENLSAYIPMDRRQAMARGEVLADRSRGAALLADISGFTPLTEALVGAFGPRRGAEELTAWLNRIYDALIEEVHRFRGSVVGFSGDAITCWFDGDDGRRVAACGLAMQAAMAGFAGQVIVPDQAVELSVKVAAVAGPVRRFIVGDPGSQFFAVIAGSTVDRLGEIAAEVRRGEVAIDAATAERLGSAIQAGSWRGEVQVSGGRGSAAETPRRTDDQSVSPKDGWARMAAYNAGTEK